MGTYDKARADLEALLPDLKTAETDLRHHFQNYKDAVNRYNAVNAKIGAVIDPLDESALNLSNSLEDMPLGDVEEPDDDVPAPPLSSELEDFIVNHLEGDDAMSTDDVPGANPANADKLAMGCWAEHKDGSLIFVESVEGGRVIFSVFDVQRTPAMEYRDAMDEAAFKRQFSWKVSGGDHWTWHDKTPFPWDRIMRRFPSGSRLASADETTSAAQRIAEARDLRAREVSPDPPSAYDFPERDENLRDVERERQAIIQRLQAAIDRLEP